VPLRKGVALQNLRIAFPEKDKKEINKIIKKTYQHYTILIFEFLRQKFININSVDIKIDEKTKKILSSKEGMILMTAHFGNWELIVPILGSHKNAAIVVKEQRNLGGDRFVCESRDSKNVLLIKTKESKRKMIDVLKKGYILGLASDQNAGNRGTKIKFFGKDASIPKGAAYFNYKTKAPIVIGFCKFNKDYSYDFSLRYINIDDTHNIENLFKEIGIEFSSMLEKEIKENPEQYFWFHRKWDRNIYKNK